MAPGTGRPRGQRSGRRQRRRKLTPQYKFDVDRADKIIAFLRAGAFVETAAPAAGIARSTLHNWLKAGQAEDAEEKNPRLFKFARAVEEAVATHETMCVSWITSAAQKEVWQAAAWLLERKHPERWRRRDTLEHTGPGGGPLQSQQVEPALTTGEKRAKLAELLKRFAEQEAAAAARDEKAAGQEDDGEVA